MKKITVEFLNSIGACDEGVSALKENNLEGIEIDKLVIWCIRNRKRDSEFLNYANWLIVRCMKYKQYVSYAVFAAEKVIDIYEKRYPDDNRPRAAIEAAKKCITRASEKNKKAAAAAATAAYAAADATYAAYAAATAAYAAADATYAAYAAYATTYAAYAATAATATTYAAYAATAATAYVAKREALKVKILKNGVKIIGGEV